MLDDSYLNMVISIPRYRGGPTFARVKNQIRDSYDKPIGVSNINPILDTIVYR